MSLRPTDRVFVQLPGGVAGPFLITRLRQVKGFTLQTLVSFPGSEKWAPAFRVLPLTPYFEGQLDIPSDGGTGIPLPVFTPKKVSPPRMTLPAAFFGEIRKEKGWTDRWFPRVVLMNLLFIAFACAVWNYQPLRIVLQQSFTNFIAPTWGTQAPALLATSLPERPWPVKTVSRPAALVNVALYQKTPAIHLLSSSHPRTATPKHPTHSLT